MNREHLIVCRNPREGAVDWCLASGRGSAPVFNVISSGATKRNWAIEAIKLAISGSMAANVTVTDVPGAEAFADPDVVPEGFHLIVACREGLPSAGRWAILSLQRDGEFRLNSLEAGIGIHLLLEKMAEETTEDRFGKSILWVRPDFRAEDLLPEPQKVA